MLSKRQHVCPVCGYCGLAEEPRDRSGNASFEICPSCGTEFGYDDAKTSSAALRRRWVAAGAPWWSRTVRPPRRWNPVAQLRDAGFIQAVMPGAARAVRSALGRALRDLADNQDLREQTTRSQIVGYLARALTEAGVVPQKARSRSRPRRIMRLTPRSQTRADAAPQRMAV